ncbi:MAG: hypothetical protein ACYCSN_08745 [Acidobacteriaceae bacterium]
MDQHPRFFGAMMEQPSAYLPLVMSLSALAVVLGNITVYGVVHQADEGSAAHIFQLLMTLQAPVVLYFAIKWIPQQPRRALQVLALQAGSWLMACAPVFFFKL